MSDQDAVVAILRQASEDLHWTVVLDRALTQGLVPASPEARNRVLAALAQATRAGAIQKTSIGTYRLPADD